MEKCTSINHVESFQNPSGDWGCVHVFTMPAFRLREGNHDEVSISTEDAGKEVDRRAKRRMAGKEKVTYEQAIKMELDADPVLKKMYCQI